MLLKETLVKTIAKEVKLDPRIVRLIIDSPIKFWRDKMSDPNEIRPVRIRYFGVASPKPKVVRGEVAKFGKDGK